MLLNCGVEEDSLRVPWRTDAETENPILWPPDAKNWLIGKDRDAGKDWRQEDKGTTEDEMVGWHHRLNGHGFGWTPGVGDGQTGLVHCTPQCCKELDTTERLNWTVAVYVASFHLSILSSLLSIYDFSFSLCISLYFYLSPFVYIYLPSLLYRNLSYIRTSLSLPTFSLYV